MNIGIDIPTLSQCYSEEERIVDSSIISKLEDNRKKRKNESSIINYPKTKSKSIFQTKASSAFESFTKKEIYIKMPNLIEQHNLDMTKEDFQNSIISQLIETQKQLEKKVKKESKINLNINQSSFIFNECEDCDSSFNKSEESESIILLNKKRIREMKERYDELIEVENLILFDESELLMFEKNDLFENNNESNEFISTKKEH